ncbi:MAG TPA: hypothetical protein VMU30_01930 [Bacteroidota bacterium]|nr:hypothetical protein [Bacteroidota bacterium]
MFEEFRFAIGRAYAKIHFRHHHDRMMNFTDVLSKSRRVLVIFPETPLDRESVSLLLKYLIERFSKDNIVILIRNDQLGSIATAPAVKTLTYKQEEISRWFIPNNNALQRIAIGTYDVAIDLNTGLKFPGAFFCKESNAPLRISFTKPQGDRFYNFQVQIKSVMNTATLYKNLLKCLEMF